MRICSSQTWSKGEVYTGSKIWKWQLGSYFGVSDACFASDTCEWGVKAFINLSCVGEVITIYFFKFNYVKGLQRSYPTCCVILKLFFDKIIVVTCLPKKQIIWTNSVFNMRGYRCGVCLISFISYIIYGDVTGFKK